MKYKRMNDSFILTINGKQVEYPIQMLPKEFISWNLGQRIEALQMKLDVMDGKQPHGKGGGFSAHLPVYLTRNPRGGLFDVNAATKGTGFVAKPEYLDYYIEKFNAVLHKTEHASDAAQQHDDAIRERIQTILEFYENIDKIDLRCFAGLEIWPGRTTRNFMYDPRVSLHFIGMPSDKHHVRYNQWQVNCIWEKITPEDKRFQFGVALRQLTLGKIGQSFVPGHIPAEQTPIKGAYPFGWNLWVIESLNKGIEALS